MADNSTFQLLITAEAEFDIFEAYNWYEEQSLGLGKRFEQDLEKNLFVITQNPFFFQELIGGKRRGILSDFKYGVYFEIVGSSIHILAVAHFSQHPNQWMGR